MDKPEDQKIIHKISLLLQSNGYLVLDKDRLWDGCETPELPPSLEMEPVSIKTLTELVRARNLDWIEAEQAENLKALLDELNASAEIVEDTIAKIRAKTT